MITSTNLLKVPFVDLHLQDQKLSEEIFKSIRGVIESTSYILGPDLKAFEKAFSEYIGTDYAIGVDSGTSALELILRAYEIGPGDEVITAANTFIATALSVSFVGATPVLVDMDPKNYNIDVTKIEEKITLKTKAIIPVHLYGQPVDMDEVMKIADKYGLIVVEDSCQAHGALYKGKRTGSIGNAAAFSFYPAKNLGAFGDGGMIVTNDEKIYQKIRILREYGQEKKYYHVEVGYNHRLDTLQAAILNTKLPYLDEWNSARRKIADSYNSLLIHPGIQLPYFPGYLEPIWHLFVIQISHRDELQAYLNQNGISTGIHYPIPIHLQKAYQHLGYKSGDFPETEKAAEKILSLPMYPQLSQIEVNYVAEKILEFMMDSSN